MGQKWGDFGADFLVFISAEQLRKFINDDKKFDELSAFINEEIAKGKK
ncbi:hypothetical protein [Pasteurella multocida]|nr:hypothetical protein [Pasteurella multocida]